VSVDSTSPLPESSTAQSSIPPTGDLRKAAKRLLLTYPLLKLGLDEYLRERKAVLERTPVGLPNPAAGGTHQRSDPTLAKLSQLDAIDQRYADNRRRVQAVEDVLAMLDAETRSIVEWYFWRGKTVTWITMHPDETKVYLSESTAYRRINEALDNLALRIALWRQSVW
jgi:RinA family phage transcriptional activator